MASTYYAAKVRPPSARAVRDAVVLAEIRRVHADPQLGRGVYGVRKMFQQLKRQGGVHDLPVPRCQLARLMKTAGIKGVRRDKGFKTTRPDRSAARPPDLVNRDFTAPACDLLR